MTGISQALLSGLMRKACKKKKNGEIIGSMLVGQDFTDDKGPFHCRPSAYNYNTYTLEDLKVTKIIMV